MISYAQVVYLSKHFSLNYPSKMLSYAEHWKNIADNIAVYHVDMNFK